MPAFDFEIGADTSPFERAMKNDIPNAAKRAATKTANAVGAALKAGLAGVAAAATAAGGLGAAVIKSASEFETLNMRLVTLMGSTSGAKARMAELAEFAAATPFSLSGLAEAEATLRGFGADAEAALPKVADLAAAMGMDLAEASSAVGRAWAGGAGAADVLRERGVLAAMEMRTGIKATEMSLTDFRKELLVTLDDFEGGANTLSKTLPGMISTLRDEWDQFARQVADAGFYDASKQALVEIQGLINDNRESIGDLARETGRWLKGALMFAVDLTGDLVLTWHQVRLAVMSVDGIVQGLQARTAQYLSEMRQGIADLLPEGSGMQRFMQQQADTMAAEAEAYRASMNATRAEADAVKAQIARTQAEVDDILSRIESADFGGAGIEPGSVGGSVEVAEQKEEEKKKEEKEKEEEEEKTHTEKMEIAYAEREAALTALTEAGAAERLRIAEEEARKQEAIAQKGASTMVSIVQESARMRIEEDASMGEILRKQGFKLMGDLLAQLAFKLAVEGISNLAAGNPKGAAQLVGAGIAAVGAAAAYAGSTGSLPGQSGGESDSSEGASAGDSGGTRTTINGTSGGGGQVADDGGLAEAGRELQRAARDLMAAARSMRRSGGGGGVTELLTKERGISGLRPSFRGA